MSGIVDVAIVGTGFSGLCMAIKLKQAGRESFVVLEQASAIGGMARSVWAAGCQSWYLDENGRNTTLWPGFTSEFWLQMRSMNASDHEFDPAPRCARTREPVAASASARHV